MVLMSARLEAAGTSSPGTEAGRKPRKAWWAASEAAETLHEDPAAFSLPGEHAVSPGEGGRSVVSDPISAGGQVLLCLLSGGIVAHRQRYGFHYPVTGLCCLSLGQNERAHRQIQRRLLLY
ncbi:hypothetical protein WMY93_014090 [Mugilogobius chulae]|uniref:Uncharacterized protein n=1 Tax=Mugilogobius chulae TaxID=88201 RepID=A0AAW0NTI4_9GOBI